MALWGHEKWPGGACTFLANQTPLACVTHSREWMPVSIQMAGRFVPPLLNCKRRNGAVGEPPVVLGPAHPHKPLLPCLEHVEGAVFCRPADLELADQVGVFSHQQVHEGVDLGVGEGLGGQ